MNSCIVCGMAGVYIEPRFGYTVCQSHVSTPPVEIGANMKQFTEQELAEIKANEYYSGFEDGFSEAFENGKAVGRNENHKRLTFQRREIRRLNKKLELLTLGFKAGVESTKQEVK